MNGQEFISNALRTEAVPERVELSLSALAILLEASIQMAKIADTAKKTLIYGKTLDESGFRDQIGALRNTLERLQQRQNFLPDAPHPAFKSPNIRILHGSVGMFGEAGELLEAVLKEMRTGKLDLVNVAEETGDSDWYKAIIHDESGVSEEQAREKVIAKLRVRYGEKFSADAALNRDLKAERKVLEGEGATAGVLGIVGKPAETEAEITTTVNEGVGFQDVGDEVESTTAA